MKKILLLCLILMLTPGCSSFRPSWVSEESWKVEDSPRLEDDIDGPLGGHFDDEGNWIPDDPKIGWTYAIPDISSGMVFDARSLDVSPSLQIELVEFDTPIPYLSTYKVDFGVAYQRAYIYTGVLITSIFEISVGVAGGWNFDADKSGGDWFVGPAFTIIKF